MTDGSMEPRSIEEILWCARPLLFESGADEFPYYWGGSAFVVEYSERIYVVTARHCIVNKPSEAIFVQDRRNSKQSLPIERVFWGEGGEYGDPVYSDIAILRADMSKISLEMLEQIERFALKDFSAVPEDELGSGRLVYRGFLKQQVPDMRNGIDYDEKRIDWLPLAGEARYVKESEFEHVHQLKLLNLPEEVTDANGLSGSPVIQLFPMPDGNLGSRLAGILVRANAEHAIGHFLSDKVIFTALHHASKI